MEFSDCNAIVS